MKYRKRLIYILISFLLISISASSSYAMFSNKITLMSNEDISGLDIFNGNVDLELSGTKESWSQEVEAQNSIENTFLVNSVDESPTIKYGPIKISPKGTTLHSNLDLKLDFFLKGEEVIENSAEPFEVIVGDVDNFGNGFGNIDPFSGELTDNHTMDIFPKEYDAKGTDRRMAPSGFYNMMEKYIGKDILGKSSGVEAISKNIQTYVNSWSIGHNMSGRFYCIKLYKELSGFADSSYLPKFTPIYMDGYTDRGICGTSDNGSNISDKYMDGANWRYLQKVEPITFKYDEFEGKVNTAVFQLFLDDLQSGLSQKNLSLNTFVGNSSSKYSVYLKIVGSDEKLEVPEFSSVINSINQSGPKGNIVALNLPIKYINIIKEASSLDKGLELIIDDNRIGTSGDSFCIDFAKLSINTEVVSPKEVKVSGYVKDNVTGAGIEGVTISSGDGGSSISDSNGYYEVKVLPGIVNLTFSKPGYKESYYTYSENVTSDIILDDINLSNISRNIKAIVNLTIIEYSDNAFNEENTLLPLNEEKSKYINTIEVNSTKDVRKRNIIYKPIKYVGTNITETLNDIDLYPGSKVEIYYTLKFASQNEMLIYNNLNLTFSSNIYIRSSQENNSGWNEDGSGEYYKSNYSEEASNNTYTDENLLIGNSKIYFEIPNTEGYWNSEKEPIYMVSRDSISDLKALNTGVITNNGKWYIYNSNNNEDFGEMFKIKIINSSNSNVTSGELYYFNTRKIYICTN